MTASALCVVPEGRNPRLAVPVPLVAQDIGHQPNGEAAWEALFINRRQGAVARLRIDPAEWDRPLQRMEHPGDLVMDSRSVSQAIFAAKDP